MGRPNAKVIAESTNKKTLLIDQVLESEDNAIWVVFYQNKPFNLKSKGSTVGRKIPKYRKIAFPNSGHALSLAKKLNKIFNTTDFSVFKLTTGEKITN